MNINNSEELKQYCRNLNHPYMLSDSGKYVNAKDLNAVVILCNLELIHLETEIKRISKEFIKCEDEHDKRLLHSSLEGKIKFYEKYLSVFNKIKK